MIKRGLITFVERIDIQRIMNRTTIEDALFPGCPIRNILSRFGDKWSLLVIYTLDKQNRAVRFKELQREISDISQKMLTVTLRTLEEDGLVTRTVYPEVQPRKNLPPFLTFYKVWIFVSRFHPSIFKK